MLLALENSQLRTFFPQRSHTVGRGQILYSNPDPFAQLLQPDLTAVAEAYLVAINVVGGGDLSERDFFHRLNPEFALSQDGDVLQGQSCSWRNTYRRSERRTERALQGCPEPHGLGFRRRHSERPAMK